MEVLAAIDIGSNAIRLVIGELDEYGDIMIMKKLREPVRLGKDVFGPSGEISGKTRDKAIASFRKFRDLLKSHGVHNVKAVATAALREASNRESFITEVRKETGLRIEIIDGLEEGRLIHAAVARRIHLEDKISLLIDIGGGSVELTVSDHGKAGASQTFKLGTVRLLHMAEELDLKEKHLKLVIERNFAPVRKFFEEQRKGRSFDLAIGTGGNFECLGKLRVALLNKSSIFSMTAGELNQLVEHLQSMTIKERIQFLRLRPDRADVVIPAALVTLAVLQAAEIDMLAIPYVGLRDGILADLVPRSRLQAAR